MAAQWQAVEWPSRGGPTPLHCALDRAIGYALHMAPKATAPSKRNPTAEADPSDEAVFSSDLTHDQSSTECPPSVHAAAQGLAGSRDPNLLPTQAQYKSNNHLTGGSARPRPQNILHTVQGAVEPNWGFWGNPGSAKGRCLG